MSPKYRKILGSLLFLIGLYVMLKEIIIPIAFNAATSGMFLDDHPDKGSLLPVSTTLSDTAFKHCNSYIQKELGEDFRAEFAPKPVNVWDFGSYNFVVNAEIQLQAKDSSPEIKKYVCRIKYDEGDQNDINNWSVYGIDGIDNI